MGTLFLQTPVSFLLSHNNYNRYSSNLIRKFIFLSLLHICFHLFFMTFRFTTSIEKDNGYISCPHTHTYANTPHIIFKMLHNSPNFMLFYKTLALTLSLCLSERNVRQEQRNNFNSHCCCCCCGCRQTKKKERRFSISNRKCVYSVHLSTPTKQQQEIHEYSICSLRTLLLLLLLLTFVSSTLIGIARNIVNC